MVLDMFVFVAVAIMDLCVLFAFGYNVARSKGTPARGETIFLNSLFVIIMLLFSAVVICL